MTARRVRPGAVIDEVFSLYGRYAGVLIPTALLVVGVVAILQGIVRTSDSTALIFLASILNLLASTLYSGFVVKFVEDVRDGRRDFAIGDLFASAAGVIGTLILNSILLSFGVGIGLLLLIIPGLYLITIWCLCPAAIVVERSGVFDAFGRSRELVDDQKMPVFLTLLLGLLIMFGFGIVFGIIGALIGDVGLVILQIVATVLAAPVFSLIVAVLFFELRGDRAGAAGPPATATAGEFGTSTPPPAV